MNPILPPLRSALCGALVLAVAAGLAAPRVAQAQAQGTFRCESQSHQTNYCDVDTRNGIELVRQLSHAGCWQGDTWGYDHRGVWVANGCRAEFAYGRGHWDNRYRDGYAPDHRYDQRDDKDHTGAVVAGAVVLGLIGAAVLADKHNDDRDDRHDGGRYGSITCESDDGRYRHCAVRGARGRVEIERVLSRAECRYGQSWGTDRDGVWVDRGCRARFSID